MRFKDIKTFPMCHYRVDVSWNYLEEHIRLQVDAGLNLEPDFQRAHIWTEEKQINYIEYCLKGGVSGRELYFNCPKWRYGGRKNYVIVDGKQRLQAARLFMENKIPAFGHLLSEYKDKPDMLMTRFSWNVASLETRKEVLQWYIDFNSGGVIHSREELERVKKLLENEQ